MSRLDWGARAIIEHNGKLLAVKNAVEKRDFYCLPGGGAEYGESVLQTLEREIFEELGARAEIGSLIYVHQMYSFNDDHTIKFSGLSLFFHVKNGQDFIGDGYRQASHAHELTTVDFIDPRVENIKPAFIGRDWDELLKNSFVWPCRTVVEEYIP